MANKKKSGLNVPTYGKAFPRGTKFKRNSDGTVRPVLPKKKK